MSKKNERELADIKQRDRETANQYPTILLQDNPPMPNLREYQRFSLDFMIKTPYNGLFQECGLGKTLTTLTMLSIIKPNRHVLIIAPKNVARCTWEQEIRKWGFRFRTMSLLVNKDGVDLPKKDREARYNYLLYAPPTICFINRDKVPGLVEYYKKRWPFAVVVIDEFQSFKAYTSSRFKALRTVRPYIKRIIGLTGTPMPKDMEDLYGEITTLDDGARLGKNITAYRETFFQPAPGCTTPQGYPYKWIPLRGAKEEIYRRIKDITVSMKNTLVKIPPVTYSTRRDDLSPEERKTYNRLKKEHILELLDGQAVTPGNAAVLAGKLSQLSSGSLYVPNPEDPEKREVLYFHDHKIQMCKWILDNTETPVLISYWFNCDKDRLMTDLKDYHIEALDGSPEMVQRWNAGEIPVMLLQPASSGAGLNLQDGPGHTLIWYTCPWSLESYMQTNARIARQGQKNPVIIHHLCINNTMDDRIMQALSQKNDSQDELLEAVKAQL